MNLDLVLGGFVWVLGLCVGSFLNVVVYRLPLGLSISEPRRSFCPHCREKIRWQDNVPIVSWILLRGRCRNCHNPISVQYPLVEALTGLVFVLVFHLLYADDARSGIDVAQHPEDWPLLAAWLVLAAALLACAAMDVLWYMVDVRVTYVPIVAAMLLFAVWPRREVLEPIAAHPLAAGAVGAFVAGVFLLWLTVWRASHEPEVEEPALPDEETMPAAPPRSPALLIAGGFGLLLYLGLSTWLLAGASTHDARQDVVENQPSAVLAVDEAAPQPGVPLYIGPDLRFEWAVPAALLAIFLTTVLVGGQPRPIDQEVNTAIELERPQSREIVLGEFLRLLVPILLGGGIVAALLYWPQAAARWQAAMRWSPGGGLVPLSGIVYVMTGAVVGAALGWFLRIVFTLIFGREAMGTGDIYILAAAGGAGGWDIAVLGLLIAVAVAIAGFVLSLLLKRTVIIPFGPWLALGFLGALWLNRQAMYAVEIYSRDILHTWSIRPDMCAMAGGLMLIGSAIAIVLARLTRRLIEPAPPLATQNAAGAAPLHEPVASDAAAPNLPAPATQGMPAPPGANSQAAPSPPLHESTENPAPGDGSDTI